MSPQKQGVAIENLTRQTVDLPQKVMVIRERPTILKAFLSGGPVVKRVLPNIVLTSLLAVVILLLHQFQWLDLSNFVVAPFTILGIALSIFLVFRNNACYDRWWEARKEWGEIGVKIRSLALSTDMLLGFEHSERRKILRLVVAFSHALRGAVRGEDVKEDLLKTIDEKHVVAALASKNHANYFLRETGHIIRDLHQAGQLDSVEVQILNEHLTDLNHAQTAIERIANTPLPFAYSMFVYRVAFFYCYFLPFSLVTSLGWFTPLFTAIVTYTFMGLDILSGELEHPFTRKQNALPLDALCRYNEITIAEALDEPAPEPLQPVDCVLQ